MSSKNNLTQTLEKTQPECMFPKSEIQIIYLKNSEELCIEAYESNSLPCSEIVKHLNRGESVFISKKANQQNPKHLQVCKKKNNKLLLNRV